ncbi:MAG: hypothetical protein Ct9H90mP16_19620 [Candidatus Poseidoniales archaeon]|nr:MAG: hypothetical protein Ct9H90mP16_19620 [Candidatus Poseidoniales archaeon]
MAKSCGWKPWVDTRLAVITELGDHLVTTTNPLSISVAGFSDFSAIEPAWWRLLNDQQTLDYRGGANELRGQMNAERVTRFLESRIRKGDSSLLESRESWSASVPFLRMDFSWIPRNGWEIADVWVEPHARRKGVATAMIKQCEHECQMRGASEVRLSVYAMNEAGMGLYRSLGYEINSYSLKKNLNPTG